MFDLCQAARVPTENPGLWAYSCDSARIGLYPKYGKFSIYIGRNKLKSIEKTNLRDRLNPEYLKKLNEIGIPPRLLQQTKEFSSGNAFAVKAEVYAQVERSIDCFLHLNTRVFMAITAKAQLDLAIKAHKVFENEYQR